jgi:formylglycine-generating enzyme
MSIDNSPNQEEQSLPSTAKPTPRSRRPLLDSLYNSLQATGSTQSKTIENSLGDRFILIPSGSFWMGSSPSETDARVNEFPRREVILTQAFYLGIAPVTQETYFRVMTSNPSRLQSSKGEHKNHPVENVSWEDANEFCNCLTKLPGERSAGRSYRLPTEAEWEFACRCGNETAFAYGEELLLTQAHYGADGLTNGTCPVQTHEPSRFGLHDMHGNVWEWCQDWYSLFKPVSGGPIRDPLGPSTGEFRVLRGGSWQVPSSKCRAAYRNGLAPHQRDSQTGFRLVLVQAS